MVEATRFLVEKRSVIGFDLIVDNGWHCRWAGSSSMAVEGRRRAQPGARSA